MRISIVRRYGWIGGALAAAICCCAEAQTATAPAATQNASAAASTPAARASAAETAPAATSHATAEKLPSLDEALPRNKVAFDFEGKPIPEILAYMAKSYGIRVVSRQGESMPTERITIKPDHEMDAREAISTMNDTLLVLGYTLVETVAPGDPPEVVVTVVPTKRVNELVGKDANGKDVQEEMQVPVSYGNDPAKISEGEDIRTQVFILNDVDPAKAKDAIASVLSAKADVTLNPSNHTMIVTDTGTHVHTAAALLMVLEKQAADAKKAAASAPAGH